MCECMHAYACVCVCLSVCLCGGEKMRNTKDAGAYRCMHERAVRVRVRVRVRLPVHVRAGAHTNDTLRYQSHIRDTTNRVGMCPCPCLYVASTYHIPKPRRDTDTGTDTGTGHRHTLHTSTSGCAGATARACFSIFCPRSRSYTSKLSRRMWLASSSGCEGALLNAFSITCHAGRK